MKEVSSSIGLRNIGNDPKLKRNANPLLFYSLNEHQNCNELIKQILRYKITKIYNQGTLLPEQLTEILLLDWKLTLVKDQYWPQNYKN